MRKEERPVRPRWGNMAHTHRLTQGSSEKEGVPTRLGPSSVGGILPQGDT